VVGLINSSFSTNFSEIGCAGEVHLAPHEDYDKFSIQVGGGVMGGAKGLTPAEGSCAGGAGHAC
jgi:hypothetical protein